MLRYSHTHIRLAGYLKHMQVLCIHLLSILPIILFLIVTAECQLPSSKWQITSESPSPWQGYGLIQRSGLCSWSLRDSQHNIELKLFEDPSYSRYLRMTLFLNYSINRAYPSYKGTAHVEYRMYQGEALSKQVKDFGVMPEVQLFNGTLRVNQGEGKMLQVKLGQDRASSWLIPMAIAHLGAKMGLLMAMVKCYRGVTSKISLSLVYVVVGMELQAHSTVVNLFQAAQEDGGSGLGMFFGFLGWGLTLCVLFALPQPLYPWETFQGLMYYGYAVSSTGMLSQYSNIILYALSPLLQIRFNIMRKEKHGICKHVFAIYLINIFLVFYVKGCPGCLLRYPLDLSLCIIALCLAFLFGIMLYLQGKFGPLVCLRECIQGKDFNYKYQINLSQGQEMMEDVCAICLQPLATEALVENFRESEEGRKGTIMRTPCNHKYHGDCLRTWLQEKTTCPLDNMPIPPCFE